MSLRVWLPLNGTLDNQGLDQVSVINNGATVDNNGKIGKCYSFDGSDDGIRIDGDIIPQLQQNNFSICFWLFSNDAGDRSIYIATTPASDWGFSIEKTTANKLRVYWQGNPDFNSSLDIPDQQWCHIAVVIKDGNCYCYKNGEKLAERISGDMTPAKLSRAWIYAQLGRDTRTGTTVLKGKMNDFRWYDHALSPLEVKQISQGLILHYPLNNNGFGQKNLLPISGSTIINSTKSFEFQGWVQSFYTKTWMNEHLVSGKQYILSYTVTCLSIPDSTYVFKEYRHSPILVHQGSGLNQVTITNDGIKNTKMSVGQSRSYKCIFTFSTISEEKKEYYGLCGYTALYRNSSNAAQYARFRIDNLKLEEGEIATPWCPNEADELYNKLGLNDNVEYDTSGYCNNGTRTGTFSWTSDTPKYSVSTAFEKGIISIPNSFVTTVDPVFSISLWFKLKSGITYTAYTDLISFSSSSYSNQPFRLELCGTPVGKSIMWFRGPSGQTGGFAVKSDISVDEWYHTALVSEGNKQYSYYVNGEKLGTYNGSANSWTPTGNVFLGENINGVFYESDFRIYATALSADDVKSLYQNSAYIDNQGNIYGAVYEEV